MKPATATTKITEAARSVQLLQIDGYSATATMSQQDCIGSTWNVDGYEWEVRVYPEYYYSRSSWVALKLIIHSKPRTGDVRVSFTGRLVDPSGRLEPSEESSMCHVFYHRRDQTKALLVEKRHEIAPGYLENDSLTVECAITVLRERPEVVFLPAAPTNEEEVPPPTPSSDLHKHLGELLESQKGADVTFLLASGGERFPAHKSVLAARSRVFMAEFFGGMEERTSRVVEVQDVEPAAFETMLRFVYTDVAPPELDDDDEPAGLTMAQHLLAAADRYGLDRLKAICEAKLAGCVDVGTAATTLALAEQHGCALLKAKCVDFVTGSPETLDAVLATEGYAHLAASCPLVLAELLKSARGRKN
ncbi:BTB/POZ and MATH domain-containing protein 2-like [Miscanthus floridulus]|uniref:BTB/POZ and MATH domain-containing protein 2-like n=1 Tax=Miscanthus floridulus TaxID=154761 RepID=UPI00345961DA